jgi:hypothetical protein
MTRLTDSFRPLTLGTVSYTPPASPSPSPRNPTGHSHNGLSLGSGTPAIPTPIPFAPASGLASTSRSDSSSLLTTQGPPPAWSPVDPHPVADNNTFPVAYLFSRTGVPIRRPFTPPREVTFAQELHAALVELNVPPIIWSIIADCVGSRPGYERVRWRYLLQQCDIEDVDIPWLTEIMLREKNAVVI